MKIQGNGFRFHFPLNPLTSFFIFYLTFILLSYFRPSFLYSFLIFFSPSILPHLSIYILCSSIPYSYTLFPATLSFAVNTSTFFYCMFYPYPSTSGFISIPPLISLGTLFLLLYPFTPLSTSSIFPYPHLPTL